MKLNKIAYLFRAGFSGIFKHGLMSFASVTTICACLIIMGSFSLLAVNIDNLIGEYEKENQILAYVDETLSQEEAQALQADIAAIENTADIYFVTNEEAMNEYFANFEDQTLFEGIEADTFEHRYEIFMDDISLMEDTAEQVRAIEGISEVRANLDIAEGFIAVRNVVSVLSLILVVILLIVSSFIMTNTLKLAAFSRREEIAVMKMVGAGNGFIRFPFIIEGLTLGLLGGGLAFFLEWGIYNFLNRRIMLGMLGDLITVIPFAELMYPVLFIYLGLGLVVGMFGGLAAIRNYLKV